MCILPDDSEATALRERGIAQVLSDAASERPMESETKGNLAYRELIESINDGVLLTDSSGRIVDLNARATALLGYGAAELGRLRIYQLISGADISIMQRLARELAEKPALSIAARILRKEGGAFAAAVFVNKSQVLQRARLIFCVHDISMQRQAEDALASGDHAAAHAKSMEAAASVAGKIAHDFNNLLTPVFTYPELIRKDLPEGCRGRDLLDVIEKAVKDMVNVTQQMLALSRRGRQQAPVSFNLNDVVRHAVTLVEKDIESSEVVICADLAENLMPIRCVPDQMLRVVQNLCQNAADAIEGAGRIDIRTENLYVDRPIGQLSRIEVGEYVRLTVRDNGVGIPDDIKEKIFDPFFTTKKTAKRRGSGLGLSVVHGIAQDHHGAVDFESAAGKGSAFSVYLPISREDMPAKRTSEPEPAGRIRTILVVDDDPQQREIITTMFAENGYQTSSLPSGEGAVASIAECASPRSSRQDGSLPGRFPDLVVLDVVMEPGMDGNEACKQILEINPRQRIVMVSGYLGYLSAEGAAHGQAGGVVHLGKPLTWGRMEQALKQLDPESGAAESAARTVRCDAGRMLIVDDEEGIRKLFRTILSAAFPRMAMDLAGNGAEAVAAFREKHHTVVLMDLRMPVMNGKTAFLEIRNFCREKNWEMPIVVFCTGFAPPSSMEDIVGNDDTHRLLTKPISGDTLVLTVKDRLASRK